MSKTIKNIIIVVVALAVLYGAYLYFKSSSTFEITSALQSSSTDGVGNTSNDQINKDTSFLSTLLNLNTITIDPTLFTSASWNSLRDNTVEIVNDGVVGRPNPFLPFEQATAVTDTTFPSISDTSIPNNNQSNTSNTKRK